MSRPLHRFGLLLAAIFQLLAPAILSVADARAEASSERGASAHIEAHSTSRCVPAHSADCAICRVLAGAGSGADGVAVPTVGSAISAVPVPGYSDTRITTAARGSNSCRAPPTD